MTKDINLPTNPPEFHEKPDDICEDCESVNTIIEKSLSFHCTVCGWMKTKSEIMEEQMP
jgi:hypothetical protein